MSDLATSRGPECEWETCWTHWLYKCLTIAETPALHYFFCWSTTKFLPGQQFSADLLSSFSVDGSKHWFLNPGPPRDHSGTCFSSRVHQKAERPALLRTNPPEAAHGRVGGAAGGAPAQRDRAARPICFQHEPPWPHLCSSQHSSHHELLLLVSTASCEAGMGLRQRPMKPKGAFPFTQWALDQAQHLFGPLCTQHSQFVLYPFLGLFLQ